ncbi:hypothetical protein [Streptomyces sp.]
MTAPAGEAAPGRPRDTARGMADLERHRRHTLELLLVCAVALVPWTVLLALTLPKQYHVHEWRVTWVGFDILLVSAMASTAILGLRRHRMVAISALTTAVLLVCDTWFDVSLAFGTPDIWMSAALAVFIELPLAGFLLHRAHALIRAALQLYGPVGTETGSRPPNA